MPLVLTDIQTPITREDAREQILTWLSELGFPIDAWQDESATRAFVELGAAIWGEQSKVVAQLAKLVILATASDTFLDAVIKSHYDEVRNPTVAATFDVDLVNVGAVNHVIEAGKNVLRASNGQTFSNVAGATASAGATTPVTYKADSPGAAGNIPAQTLEITTPLAGVSAVFDGTITTVGADAEADAQYRERARTKWANLQFETADAKLTYLIRTAVPGIFAVGFDRENPRGPFTADVYLAGENATAGGADVTAAQAVLDAHVFGNGSVEKLVQAVAAPVQELHLAATAYIRGVTAEAFEAAANARWREFLPTIPIGGFDLSPGPTNTIEFGQIVGAFAREVDFDELALEGLVSIAVTTPAGDTAVTPNSKIIEGDIDWTIVVLTT